MELGKVSESVLKRSVLKYVQLNNKQVQNDCKLFFGAQVGADCAVFQNTSDTNGMIACAIGTAVGRNRMVAAEALINACNNLSCRGAIPFGAELSFVLPEAIYESEIRHMMEEVTNVATKNQILILGGHTTVSKDVTETVATITALGNTNDLEKQKAKAGMDVVISKWIGLQGTAKIASAQAETLEKRLPKRFVSEAKDFDKYASVLEEARIAKEAEVCAMHDVSGGGIFRALWELAELADTGIRIDLKKIPLKQETIEVCEVFGLNPYELLSGGALIMVTKNGEELVERLLEHGINATLIGKLTNDRDRVLVTYSEDGEELRYLERPRNDEIDKIL